MITTNTTTAKDAALDLARRGWAVFPCVPHDKTPATANGFKDASTNPEVVSKMFATRSDFNVGVATGPASKVWVLDPDKPEGIADLDKLQQQHGELPETVRSATPRRGRHHFFAWRSEYQFTIGSKVGGKSIDYRGAGGYAVVAPSSTGDGSYLWERAPGETPIAEAPSWLVDWITSGGKRTEPSTASCLSFRVAMPIEDLLTAPGAGKGERHDRAKRLIGSALGRGLDPCEVARQAVEWARRCSPPLSDEETLRLVSDLARKEGSKVEAIREEIEAAPLPEAALWPVLDRHAYHGLAGDIVQAIEPETEADPAAVLVQLLVAFGNLVGRGPHFVVEGTNHHANLFAVLCGKTARGRKGTSEGRVRQILGFVDEEWSLNNIKTGLVSGEGLIWSVRDPIHKIENIREKGRIVGTEEVLADPGIEDKRLLVVESEFAAVLRVCRRETNTLSPTLRSAWDSGTLRTMAKNMPAKATDAHISIIGHITVEELRRALDEADSFNGYANRHLWVAVRRSKLLPDGGRDLDLAPFAERLAAAVTAAQSIERMRRDQGAAALWRRIYAELADDSATGLLAAVTSRAEAQVLRLGMIYALLDSSRTIRADHLRAAAAIWRYCRSSASLIFGTASGDPLRDKVLDLIRQSPGIDRRGIHRATGNHVKADKLVEVLAGLRDSGLTRVEKIETGGRPSEHWYPCEQSEQSEQRGGGTIPAPEPAGLSSLSSLNSQVAEETEEKPAGLCSLNSLSSQAEDGFEEVTI